MARMGTKSAPFDTMNADQANQPLAIVGMACRLPGGLDTPSHLWEALMNGSSGRGPVPESRFNIEAFHHPDSQHPASINSHEGYFLDNDIRAFDHEFFNINSLEAKYMDPQQRQLLEVAYECIESAGITLDDISNKEVGCYIANFTNDFTVMQAKDPELFHRYSGTGMGLAILANRISHCFNLKGPSVTIDTACSSSFFALHQACAALRAGECEAAFVGGANLIQSPELYMGAVKAGMISGTAMCHTFDISADGYARAEGVGVLFVKRLSDAIRDGDPIQSVIRGTAVNSNGRTNGISLPSPSGQEAVIRKAYANARLSPDCTDYIEAHGTGTEVGDGIEVDAFSRVLKHASGEPILIGSIKTNLGHSEAVSGISSLMKMTMALGRGVIPQTIGVKKVHPKLLLEERNARIVTRNMPWPAGSIRRASLNSFGYGGSNGHVILENAQAHVPPNRVEWEERGKRAHCRVIPLSCRSKEGLSARRTALTALDDTTCLEDIAYTLSCRRAHFEHRGYIIATEQNWRLDVERGLMKTSIAPKRTAPVLFAFTGQGAQWAAMAATLLDSCPLFAQTIDGLDIHLATLQYAPKWNLRDVLSLADADTINQAAIAQPACTALQIGLVTLLKSLGVSPAHVIGHSSGEIAAAFTAGCLTAEEAIAISYYRGLAVSQKTAPGAMAVLGCEEETALRIIKELGCEDRVQIACFNSPVNLTVSGDPAAIEEVIRHAQTKLIFARRINTGNKAYHSKHMALISHHYEELITPILQHCNSTTETSITVTSTLYARKATSIELRDPTYWSRNLENPVLFSQAMLSALAPQRYHVVEIGPHSTFKIAVAEISESSQYSVQYTPALVRNMDPLMTIMQLAGSMFLDGLDTPIKRINSQASPFAHGSPPLVVTNIAPYPWRRGPVLWSEGRISSEYRQRIHSRHDLLGSAIVGASNNIRAWRNVLSLHDVQWLQDHRLDDDIVFPAAGYIAMAIEGFRQVAMARHIAFKSVVLRDIKFINKLTFDAEGTSQEIFTELSPMLDSFVQGFNNQKYNFSISSFSENQSTIHCRGIIECGIDTEAPSASWACPYRTTILPKSTWYRTMYKNSLNFGPAFQRLDGIKHASDHSVMEVFATCKSMSFPDSASRYKIHPTSIDSLFQAGIISTTSGRCDMLRGKIPVSIDKLTFRMDTTGGASTRIMARSSFGSHHTAICHAEMRDDNSTVVVVEGLQISPWRKHDFSQDAIYREPFLQKAWILEQEAMPETIKPHVNGVDGANGLNGFVSHNGTNGAHEQPSGLFIIPSKNEDATMEWRRSLADLTGIEFSAIPLADVRAQDWLSPDIVISCLEVDEPLLCRMGSEDLQRVQVVLRKSTQIIWIHRADALGRGQPDFALIDGLSRALTFEQPTLALSTFDIGQTGFTEETCVNLAHIVEQMRAGKQEREYGQKQGLLHVPRFLPVSDMNARFQQSDHGRTLSAIKDAGKCHLDIKSPGVFQSISFSASADVPFLDPDLVEVQVKAASINAKDYYVLRGLTNTRDATCSLDFSGTITRVGAAVRDLSPGDHVVGMAPNHLGTYIQVPQWACCKLRPDESFTVMASLPVIFGTALYALQKRARLQAGETVLIHSAAGGAGLAAIQVAKLLGAHIFATVGTEAKKEFLVEQFNIPRQNIFSSRSADFADAIRSATQGAGVDVVFNSLTGPLLQASWDVCADFGRFVDISKRDCLDGGRLDMRPFSRSTAYHAFDLTELYYSRNRKQNATWQELIHQSVAMIRSGALVPPAPLEVFDASQIAKAFTYFGSAARMGKIVISFEDPSSEIPYEPPRYQTALDGIRAYVLIGCLGGLGRALSSWMLDRGARRFVFMGRSGASNPAALEHIQLLEARGAQVTVFKGDVSVFEDVRSMIDSIDVPVAGVVHAAMNLDESLFDQTTATQWHAGLAPKVKGAWNLHQALLTTPLDFFLVTSSVAGTVGLATESSYCAANTYLDAFARHRRELGLPATSVALGCISEVGYLHERPEVEKMLHRKGIATYDPNEVMKIIDTALSLGDSHNGLVVTGLELKGLERILQTGDLRGTIFDDVRLTALTEQASANLQTLGVDSAALDNDIDAAVAAAIHGNSSDALKSLHSKIGTELQKTIAGLLLLEPDSVPDDALLADFGMDSMLAAELRTAVFKTLKCDVPLAVLLDEGMDLGGLAGFVGGVLVGKGRE